ncbi:MAG: DUF1326 domain-containing protein [Proteobacteria bacterium]|nr:DUF1326 domain-containing protein [Pseudomonadota bacterium]
MAHDGAGVRQLQPRLGAVPASSTRCPPKAIAGQITAHIDEGRFREVRLDGLNWVVIYGWPGSP